MRLKQKDIGVIIRSKLKGSITVEAAFSFTLTIFILFMFLGPLLIIKTSTDLMISINEASKVRCNYETIKYRTKDYKNYQKIKDKISSLEYLEKGIKGIENIVSYISTIRDYATNYDENHSEYKNIKSLLYVDTNVYDENTAIVRYDFELLFDLPYNILNIYGIKNRFINYRRAFVGADPNRFNRDNKDFVYLAENYVNSRVYHNNIDCSYLEKNVTEIIFVDINNYRNENGEKYNKCSYCIGKKSLGTNDNCYITKWGDKYHIKSNCHMMTAYVTKITVEEAVNMNLRLCPRCQKRNDKEGGGEDD